MPMLKKKTRDRAFVAAAAGALIGLLSELFKVFFERGTKES